jgi:hypothetical protein
MRRIVVAGLAALCTTLAADQAVSQTMLGPEPTISWQVKSRFRLFRYEADFLKHVDADRGDGLVAAERRLAQAPTVTAGAHDAQQPLPRPERTHGRSLRPATARRKTTWRPSTTAWAWW